MDRKHVVQKRLSDPDDGYVPGPPAYRMGLVWPLTREAVSLGGVYDAEQRLQKHIVVMRRLRGPAERRTGTDEHGLTRTGTDEAKPAPQRRPGKKKAR